MYNTCNKQAFDRVARIVCAKRRLTVYCLHQKQLAKHFQAAGMQCFYQRALERFNKKDFICTSLVQLDGNKDRSIR